MRTIEAIKGREQQVLDMYGLSITGNKHGDCGICGSKKSLRITVFNDNLSYICKCGNGNILHYISESTGQSFKDVALAIDKAIGNTREREKPKTKSTVADRFKRMSKLKGTNAEKYLISRGLSVLPTMGARFHESSIYCVASDDNHNPIYIHRTFLDGDKKADGVNKKLYKVGGDVSCAIKLFPAGEVLGIAEGIETALSVKQLYKVNCWSTMNTSLMKRFKAPNGVKHLMIYADSDKNGAGHAAAFECANKNMLANNDVERVTVRWPKVGDFNDVLNDAESVYEWRL